ncbi:MAG TPA: hypothetical protein VHB46_11005 [Burkholderiales bacterium]|nr:hypothetical protein [Burkholderiales bacterium]
MGKLVELLHFPAPPGDEAVKQPRPPIMHMALLPRKHFALKSAAKEAMIPSLRPKRPP